jgi:hypothetical protein
MVNDHRKTRGLVHNYINGILRPIMVHDRKRSIIPHIVPTYVDQTTSLSGNAIGGSIGSKLRKAFSEFGMPKHKSHRQKIGRGIKQIW